jgi:hypothetical protein
MPSKTNKGNTSTKKPVQKPGLTLEQRRKRQQQILFAVLSAIIIITWIISIAR